MVISVFDAKAGEWDLNPMHIERSKAIASEIIGQIPLRPDMKALEFGAGTGMTSFLLMDHLGEIVMIDNSAEMIKVANEKIKKGNAKNLKAICTDIMTDPSVGSGFDLIFTQMVLHHVADTERIISIFARLLKKGGYLVLADLYTEDGSFHGEGFDGHNGFDTIELSDVLRRNGFKDLSENKCFEITRESAPGVKKTFDVFFMKGIKS